MPSDRPETTTYVDEAGEISQAAWAALAPEKSQVQQPTRRPIDFDALSDGLDDAARVIREAADNAMIQHVGQGAHVAAHTVSALSRLWHTAGRLEGMAEALRTVEGLTHAE